ncbi:hypothetical protein GGR50DRAFT_239521 [Xylaria sp. CBS 124048]|nr:hypothetical protein GGR50DRAFT_239521 [Xylaria sp. CBS 124048]
MASRRHAGLSHDTTSTEDTTRRSFDSCDSVSTDPSSLYDSPLASTKAPSSRSPHALSKCYNEELCSNSSVETYSSEASYDEDEDEELDDCVDYPKIPPLPEYRHEIEDINVRASTPEDFATLFPSMNKLIIRHDDLTDDGNMNLRVDTIVSGRRKKTVQLFHLRMRDLNKRDFSLRRYCRDSGREVCNSKRKYADSTETRHPKLPKSVSKAVKTLTCRPILRRSSTSGSLFSHAKTRQGTSHSTTPTDDENPHSFENPFVHEQKPKARLIPTNVIKLEFSNYARVDVRRRGHKVKKYEFEWWQHKYTWKRVTDKLTGTISFHLFCDNNSTPVAHMIPETRTPNQILSDEKAGGWIPPYHMWINDQNLIDAQTDVADVVVSTGLMALVDDCIKDRIKTHWSPEKGHARRFSLPDVEFSKPRSFVQHLLHRRLSEPHQRPSSPLRSHRAVAIY